MILKEKSSRKYFQLMQKVGSHHKYQLIILTLMIAINIIQTAVIFMMPYLLHQSNYSCQGLTTQQCNQFVCKLAQPQRLSYLTGTSPFLSLADQLGNFRCEKAHQLTTLQSLVFIGAITGMWIFSLFTERLGRKKSLLLSMTIFLIGILVIYFSKSILNLGVGIFICFAGCETAIQYSVCYATEVVDQNYRFKFCCTVALTDSLGIIINSLAYYFLKDWRIVFLIFYILPIIAVIIGAFYYIQDTPIDLLSTRNSSQILKSLQKIADLNEVQNHGLDVEKIENLQEEYHLQSKNKQQAFNLMDLCRFSSLRVILVPLIFANFFCNYLFYAPSFIQKNISQNLFFDNIISGISKMASVVFVYYTFTKLQRKKVCYVLNFLIIIFSFLMTLDIFKTNGLFKFIIYFTFRMKVSVLQSVTYMINYEAFPTQIRATAAIVCYIAGESAGIAQPWMNKLAESIRVPYSFIFAAFGLANFINTAFLRETFGIVPPEIVQELHHQTTYQPNISKKEENSIM